MADEYESLFEKRVPEAAARQLAIVLASAAEWHFATLEQLKERKSSSARDIDRQQKICDQLAFHCADLGVQPYGLNGWVSSRLRVAMSARPSGGTGK